MGLLSGLFGKLPAMRYTYADCSNCMQLSLAVRLGTQMRAMVEFLRLTWRGNFSLPGRRTYKVFVDDWFGFVLMWIWSIAGVVPGALAAASIIGHFHITNQTLQDVISVPCAFLSMLVLQLIGGAWYVANQKIVARRRGLSVELGWTRELVFVTVYLTQTLWFYVPLVAAAFAIAWYLGHVSPYLDTAARGAGGALIFKVVLTLAQAVIVPAVKTIIAGRVGKPFWQWLFPENKAKTTDA